MEGKVNAHITSKLINQARELETQAERLRQYAKETCSHQEPNGKLWLGAHTNQCMGCGAIVSFTVDNVPIYRK